MGDYCPLHNVRELVKYGADHYGDRDFLRYYEDSQVKGISFNEFLADAYAVAAWAMEQKQKLGRSVKVAMLSPNNALYLKMIFGIMSGGGISVPIDPQMNQDTLCNCLNKAEVDMLIYDEGISFDQQAIYDKCKTIRKISFMKEEGEAIIRKYTGVEGEPEISEKDCAVILFTSGTTGEEKGVMLSQGNLVDSAFNVEHTHHVQLSILPFHHAFGLNADCVLAFVIGSTTCFGLGMDKLGESLHIFEPSNLNMVPMIAQALYTKMVMISKQTGKTMEECKRLVYGPNMVQIITGGAHLPAELVQKYHDIGIYICQGYGMTECSPTISTPAEDRPDKAYTAGHIVKGCVSRVVDGELQVKSPAVMMGYINAPELTAQVITEDGWLRTGDIGYEDEEGFIHIEGRKKNLIILSNGENVSPEQLEKLLLDHQLVQECLVYGEGTQIVAEIVPDPAYAKQNQITDVPGAIAEIVAQVNEKVTSYKKIMKYLIRKNPLLKTGSGKIIRTQKAAPEDLLTVEKKEKRLPENEVQAKLYELTAGVLGNSDFGTDTNLFEAGMDSLGCIMTLSAFSESMDFNIELDEFMANPTILKLEALYQKKQGETKLDYSKRPVYQITRLQQYFAYVMRGNTTANIPFLYKLDESIDLAKLKKAIEELFEVHPILKGVIQMYEHKGYAMFRDDEKVIDIPVYEMSEEEWMEAKDALIVPYLYTDGEPLYHISLYNVEGEKFMYFDVAHIISDGVSAGIMLRNIARLYDGLPVKREEFTFYECMLEDIARQANGSRQSNAMYFEKLMEGKRFDRSILAKSGNGNLTVQRNAVLRASFDNLNHNRTNEFCRKNGISKNILFLNAFNYCISVFSDEDDTVSTSIHSGRTDSRWGAISGSFFTTYIFRCRFDNSLKITEMLDSSAKQVMESMCCHMNTIHADEMFFQYQGDLFSDLEIGGRPAVNVPMQLDSLPFHLMIYEARNGFSYELRFWENRFDEKLLRVFMDVYEAVVRGMIRTDSVAGLRNYIPKKYLVNEKMILTCGAQDAAKNAGVGNDAAKNAGAVQDAAMNAGAQHTVTIRSLHGEIQPVGGWGRLYLDGTDTGRIARLNAFDQIDYLEDSGRVVMQEMMTARYFVNMNSLKEAFEAYPGIDSAAIYSYYGEDNNYVLTAELTALAEPDYEALKAFAAEQFKISGQPSQLIVNGKVVE